MLEPATPASSSESLLSSLLVTSSLSLSVSCAFFATPLRALVEVTLFRFDDSGCVDSWATEVCSLVEVVAFGPASLEGGAFLAAAARDVAGFLLPDPFAEEVVSLSTLVDVADFLLLAAFDVVAFLLLTVLDELASSLLAPAVDEVDFLLPAAFADEAFLLLAAFVVVAFLLPRVVVEEASFCADDLLFLGVVLGLRTYFGLCDRGVPLAPRVLDRDEPVVPSFTSAGRMERYGA